MALIRYEGGSMRLWFVLAVTFALHGAALACHHPGKPHPPIIESLDQGVVLETFSFTKHGREHHFTTTFAVPESLPLDLPYVLSCSSEADPAALRLSVNGEDLLSPGSWNLGRVDVSLYLQRSNTLEVELLGRKGSRLDCGLVAIFGPVVFSQVVERPHRRPLQPVVLTFDYPLATPAVLRIVNGSDEQARRDRAALGSVVLNGHQVLGPRDLNLRSLILNTEVQLLAHNELRITLLGSPRAKVFFEILPLDLSAPLLTVTSPEEGLLTNQLEVEVTGTVSDLNPVTVTVNGIAANVEGGTFSVLVPLEQEGVNLLTITATDLYGRSVSEVRHVVRDTLPPELWFTSPATDRLAQQVLHLAVGSSEPLAEVSYHHNLSPVDGDMIYPQEFFNRVEAVATDLAGNQGTIEARFVYDALMAKVVVRFPFNEGEGELAHDESLKDRHATLDGVLWTEGAAGTALSFDGISGGAVVEGVEGMQLAAEEPLTISCMVRPEPAGGPLVELTIISGGLSEQDRCRLDGGYWDETAPRQCNYALMAENLVYLDFEEIRQETLFTYVPDRSLLNNHALILGDPVLTDQGRRGRGLVFDDLDELVIDKAYHQISLQPALTIEAWLRPDAEVEPLYLVHKPDFLRVMISTDLVEVTIDPLDVHFSYEQTNILPAEEWTHLAVTVVGQRLSIYRNGNPILSEDLPRPLVDPNNLDTYYLLNPWSTHFSGVLDEFRLYDRGKSQRELCIDNYGTFYPSSAYCDLREPGSDLQQTIVYLRLDEGEGLETLDHSNHDRFGTLQGATWTEGYTGSAVQFTTGTSIELADTEYLAFPLPELSLLLWVRPDTTADEPG